MLAIIVIVSILIITGFVWLANKIWPFQICPICAGVAGTWLWLLAANFLGYGIDLVIPALLMGGSVVGIAYQIEKWLPPNRSPLLLKTLFIPAGFIAAYSILTEWWSVVFVSIALLVIIAFTFLYPRKNRNGREEAVKELEDKMKNCC